MNLLTVQLLTSFIVGGSVITLISFLVERIDKRYAGLLLASPTTVVLGLFFLGLAVGTEKVLHAIPSIFLPLGFSIFFSVFYLYVGIYISRLKLSKITEILITYLVSILGWLLLISPILLFKFSNLIIGIIGCIVLIGLSYIIFQSFPQKNPSPRIIKYSFNQKIIRGLFIGLVIASIVYLGKTLGSFWGGVFSVFPAAFTSTFPIFHWYNKPKDLYPLMKGIPFGTLSVFIYVISCLYTFSLFGYAWGTLISYVISLTYIVAVSKFKIKI